jgi:LysM repeat protein
MFPHKYSRTFVYSFSLLALVISSCAGMGPSNAYPTYDPFAPLNGAGTPIAPVQQGEVVIQADTTHTGPTPTLAPVSVTLAPTDLDPSFSSPTPDLAHALPAPRDVVDQYTVQPGDTLGSIAQGYGITLEALMQANGLNETSILSVGTLLNIPPISADLNPGSSFKIIPDSELVYGPSSVDFDLDAVLKIKSG